MVTNVCVGLAKQNVLKSSVGNDSLPLLFHSSDEDCEECWLVCVVF